MVALHYTPTQVGVSNFVEASFFERSLERGQYFIDSLRFRTQSDLDDLGDFLAQIATIQMDIVDWDGDQHIMFESDEGDMVYATSPRPNILSVNVSCKFAEDTVRWADAIAAFIKPPPEPPAPEPVVAGQMPLFYWMMTPNGPQRFRRTLDSQDWSLIRDNYPASVQAQLDGLAALRGFNGGKIILLNGTPGTGKTRAMLGLVETWRHWSDVHVITDPERFFGDPSYMIQIVMDFNPDRWNLLVVEDGDEFMDAADSGRKDQSVGRLLNLNDGFIGQGLKVATLLSTNVDVESFNSAVTRPGRCLANVHFPEFDTAEAVAWLAARDTAHVPEEGIDKMSLASMFEIYRKAHPELFVEEDLDEDDEDAAEAYSNDPEDW